MVGPVARSGARRSQKQRRRAQSARRRQRRERAAEAVWRAFQADFDLLYNPEVPPQEAAAAFFRLFSGVPANFALVQGMLDELGDGRSAAIAKAGLEAGESAVALTLAADVALVISADPILAGEYLERARLLDDDPALQPRLARVEAAQGQVTKAAARLNGYLAVRPADHAADLARGELLNWLVELEADPDQICPCGSGRSYAACCAADGAALLASFRERRPTYELHEAVLAYAIQSPALMDFVMASVDEWVEEGALAEEEVDWQGLARGAPEAQVLRLAVERALSTQISDADAEEDADEDDQGRTILQEFAHDPATPPDLARRADDWYEHGLWAIWQVEDLNDPGTLISNYLSGTKIYAQIPDEQRDGLRRWTIVLGYFFPVDGIWRSGSVFYTATPAEGRRLAQGLLAFLKHVSSHHERGHGPIWAWATEATQALKARAWVPEPETTPPAVTAMVSSVTQVMFPALVAGLRRDRGALPDLRNTDGDPMEWIEATLQLTDPKVARRALAKHPDFEAEGDEVAWLGRQMSASEHAQAQAQLRGQGLEPDPDALPSRYSRGSLKFKDDHLLVTVNSRHRLDTLLEILSHLGHPAKVVTEAVTDVSEELQSRLRWMSSEGAAGPDPGARQAWLASLPDDPNPALDGLTLREAARREEYQERLEMLLQEIEYQAGPGLSGTDPTGLRQVLGWL